MVRAIGILLASTACEAGSLNQAFNVNITLSPRLSLCVNETLTAHTGPMVQVVCRGGQYVDISHPVGGGFSEAAHVYRLHFGPGEMFHPEMTEAAEALLGSGVITGLRIDRATNDRAPIVMLVSF